MVENTSFLPEVNVEPLGDVMLDFLIDRDQEEPFVDFRETLNIPQNVPFAKKGKDSFTFLTMTVADA
jgi:hypothetical protein